MKRRILKHTFWISLLLFGIGMYSLNAGYLAFAVFPPQLELLDDLPQDTIPARYPVSKTTPEEYDDILTQSPADLRSPENVKTQVEYDIKTGTYLIRTKVGDMELGTPLSLTPEEYQDYSMQQSLRSYFRQKNEEEFQKEADKTLNLTDIQFGIGAAERVFGPGGVRVRTQGSADITLGLKRNTTKDPSLPERSRTRTFFNFDETVQLNVQATVGTKVNFDMNYNTETSFDFDSQKLKLAYTGDEDEIIKTLEAGNVSMTTNNSLIRGGAALFGMKADLQFGKLRVNTLFAQQESESQTVNSKGGVQTRDFEITVDQYDENRHFFLGHYFYNGYDKSMSTMPYIQSQVNINRMEVWITNRRGNYDQARNIVAFADLAEYSEISNTTLVQPTGSRNIPSNGANNLYSTLNSQYLEARNISNVSQVLNGVMEASTEFEKIESARLLDPSEYTYHPQLGYISLRTQLQPGEVLAVAYNYTYSDGQVYQVGEFSTDNPTNTENSLYVKLLRGKSLTPDMPFWRLMMKNIYALGAYSIQKEKFQMNILYQSDTTGVYLSYLPDVTIDGTQNQILLRVMNLDRLDSKNERYPDGFFDFVEGYTVQPETGRIIFPTVEPFGSHLRQKINNNTIADRFVYQELYDSTLTVAQQIAEKNKFLLRGEYKASSGAEIQLGATNVARGSVVVTAAGAVLTENVDYTVDYTSGVVTILNESIISSGTPVSVSLENQSMYSMQRKTMMGLDLNYQFNKDFSLGATVMHMSEMPLTVKTAFGDESIKNTLWGLNASYKTESQWLTNMLDKIPLLTLTRPSQISFNAEFAHLIAGHYENKYTGGYSYLDDFESTQSGISLQNPYSWSISSTPYDDSANALFPEASLSDDTRYGLNRALMAWYYIDGIFTRRNSSQLPRHIDVDQLSNHYVRAVEVSELYPNREQGMSDASLLPVLNIAYYPSERGPYNLDADNINPDGSLANPQSRWGGIMRRIEQSDFETANIEYIEFWMLDPFIYNENPQGGDLYFNLGDISEDILKDGKKFFENGLPIDPNDTSKFEETAWGRVPTEQSTVYAFDNTTGAREVQDVGLNGLSSEQEVNFPTYAEFIAKLRANLPATLIAEMEQDPFSPLKNPGTDKFHYFRGDDYDANEVDILTRYKRYNGTEGNSQESTGRYSTSAKTLPDVEDINQNNTMDDTERYFEYKISLRPEDMQVGSNFIVAERVTKPKLMNGTREEVKWYQFKVPVRQYERAVGSIRDFKSIPFMRMYMTGFSEETVLRFGTLELVRGEWRTYAQDLSNPAIPPTINGTLDVTSVNIEENGDREPVNYVLPPGVTRMLDQSQPQLRQENEQALSLKVTNLAPQDARAIYKTTNYDMRQYKRLQLFTHAERFIGDNTGLANNDLSVFIRLGSDYKNNYYEYEVPLSLTPHGEYSWRNPADQLAVWPASNMLDIDLEVLTNLKLNRNKARRQGNANVSYNTVFSEYDPNNTLNTVSIVGNPSLSEVKTIMIGVRNNSGDIKSGEIWVNELRLTDFNEEGGWAANANLNLALSDLGTVNLSGRIETAGFGSLDQSLSERRMDDYKQYSVATNLELGKFFPEKAKVSLPMYYAYSKEMIDPKYNPIDQDIKLSDAMDALDTDAEKDSLRNLSQERTVIKSIAFNNVRVNIQSKNPMPYDPANFTLGYSFSENSTRNPETEYETTKDYRGNFAYNYTPYAKPFRPFEKIKKNNGYTKYIKQFGLNYLPTNISFQTSMMRNYYELQLRDLANTGATLDPSFSQNWEWDRAFRLTWNLTNSLNMTFNSGTNARIVEPHQQVNKDLNSDGYEIWKDSVKQSIRDLGTPMRYDQSFMVMWNMPFQHIPILDWINSSINYNATYNWDRGATINDIDMEIGNTIKNQRQIDWQGNFNFQGLYNKSKFLREVNQKFSGNTNRRQTAPKKPIVVEKEITLNMDSGTVVNHNMLSRKVRITAVGANGKRYPIKYKPLNYSNVVITNKDTATLKLRIEQGPQPMEGAIVKVAEYGSRFLMMLRRLNVQYSVTDGMMLPGYRPEVGDIFGQKRMGVLAPGLGFAFGSVNRSYIDEAQERDWLVMSTSNVTPAMINHATNLTGRASLEPIAGLKIDLNVSRVNTTNTEVQFMYEGMPEIQGGSFMMTTVAIRTAFASTGDGSNGYNSSTFQKFLDNRNILRDRIEGLYVGTNYPNSGFLAGTPAAGQPFNPNSDDTRVSENSADVLIPAFLAAYTGKDANKIGLSPIPSLSSLLPNWRITYDGLIKIPAIKKYFKSMVLSHQYRCTYSVGAFSSFLNWVDAGGDGLGYIRNVQTGNPTPSSPYEISSVSITEGFSPLFGVDATLLNNITGRAELRKTRNLSLNVSSYQIVEALSNEIIIGMGYKLTEFNKVLKRKPTQNFSNDLTLRFDFSYRKMQSLIRRIEQMTTQATSGNVAKTLQFSADYGLSRALTLRAFYDLQINEPLISNASFPTTNSSYGISIQFSLTQ